eukprot:2749855-Alexandrium_andersonii.AAC.1
MNRSTRKWLQQRVTACTAQLRNNHTAIAPADRVPFGDRQEHLLSFDRARTTYTSTSRPRASAFPFPRAVKEASAFAVCAMFQPSRKGAQPRTVPEPASWTQSH